MSDPERSQLSVSQFEALTYSRLNWKENTLDDNDFGPPCTLGSLHGSVIPQCSLGKLDGLPLELVQYVLVELDLLSLTRFKKVNRRALQAVHGLPEYKDIVTFAPNLLRGVFSIEMAQWITFKALFGTFCTVECETCGAFGGFVFLLSCKWVCFWCFYKHRVFLPLSSEAAAYEFAIPRRVFDTPPYMRSLPGTYSQRPKRIRGRLRLVAYKAAKQAAIEFHGSAEAMSDAVRAVQQASDPDEPGHVRGYLLQHQPTRKVRWRHFMAVVQAPAFNLITRKVVKGAFCAGCHELGGREPPHRRRRFTQASFREHVLECGPIRDGKHWPDEKFED